MTDRPSPSRRQLLGTVGATATGVGGYIAGVRSADSAPEWLTGRGCAPAPLVTSPTDWAGPRHDRANTGRAPARASPDWPLDRTWELEWPIGGRYRPAQLIVADGIVIAFVDDGQQGVLLAISIEDGQIRWRRPAQNAETGWAAAASGTVFVDVELPNSPAQFAARSLGDGTASWTSTDGLAGLAKPTFAGGQLLAVDTSPDRTRTDGEFALVARDARTGSECWATVHDGRPLDMAVADGRVVLPTRDAGIVALDTASGEQQWRSDVGGDTVALIDGRVVSTRFPGELRVLSLANGTVEWSIQNEYYIEGAEGGANTQYGPPGFEVGAVTPAATVYHLDVPSEYPGRLQARALESGELLWDVGPDPTPVEAHSYSRPVVIGDDVVAMQYARRQGSDGSSTVLLRHDLADGAELDRLSFPVDDIVYPPVVADSTLLVPTAEQLIAYT